LYTSSFDGGLFGKRLDAIGVELMALAIFCTTKMQIQTLSSPFEPHGIRESICTIDWMAA
jgi:hypothetical protein